MKTQSIKRTFFTTLFFVGFMSFGQVKQEAYAKAFKELNEVSGQKKNYETMINQMFEIFKKNIPESKKEMFLRMEKELMKGIDEINEKLLPIYKKYLTYEDLLGLIKFYKTPLGKKFVRVTPPIQKESMKIGAEWGEEIAKKIREKMTEL